MRILTIDPGTSKSAWMIFDTSTMLPSRFGIDANADVLEMVKNTAAKHLVIEMVESFGMPVGREVFETIFWIGRFCEAFAGGTFDRIYRRTVKMHLCQNNRADDAAIRCVLMDRFGGKQSAVGLKRTPGPLYGVSKDVWSALAIAMTYAERL